jgi:hypothetical protein
LKLHLALKRNFTLHSHSDEKPLQKFSPILSTVIFRFHQNNLRTKKVKEKKTIYKIMSAYSFSKIQSKTTQNFNLPSFAIVEII